MVDSLLLNGWIILNPARLSVERVLRIQNMSPSKITTLLPAEERNKQRPL